MAQVLATPGVYIEEKSAFPSSAVQVATAVPAFIGYTEKAIRANKSLINVPTRITSLSEFHQFFGASPKTTYTISEDDATGFSIAVDAATNFNLYKSIRLFFSNGGSTCYIVSVGNYSKPVSFKDLNDEGAGSGIPTLLKYPEPTMIVIPEIIQKLSCQVRVVLITVPIGMPITDAILNPAKTHETRLALFSRGAT